MNRQTRCFLIAALLTPSVYAQNSIDLPPVPAPLPPPTHTVDVVPLFNPYNHQRPEPSGAMGQYRNNETGVTASGYLQNTPQGGTEGGASITIPCCD